jgi:RNA polymerase sigma-70 factor, ECF subfamily
MGSEIDLNDLMVRCAGGEHGAFAGLARHLGGRMFALAYRLMGHNRAAAEDAVQDALIKIWTTAPNWQPKGRVEGWVSTIVHHCCMDIYRKQHVTDELTDTTGVETSPSAPDEIYARQEKRMLMAGINTLPDRQRQVVLLAYFGETSNREIARTLNISVGAVESLLVRARANLAQNLPAELKEHGERK